jgi:hypothetical protein
MWGPSKIFETAGTILLIWIIYKLIPTKNK